MLAHSPGARGAWGWALSPGLPFLEPSPLPPRVCAGGQLGPMLGVGPRLSEMQDLSRHTDASPTPCILLQFVDCPAEGERSESLP